MRIYSLTCLALFVLGGFANAQDEVVRQPLLWKMSLPADAAQWEDANTCRTSEGLLIDIKTSDSAIVWRGALDAAKFNTLEIEMSVEPAGLLKAQLFWDQGRGFSRRASAESAPLNRETTRCRINLDASPRWRGAIRGLRLHPANRPCRVLIRSLKLYYRPPPSTPAPREIQWVEHLDVKQTLKETERPVMFYLFRIGDAQCRQLRETTFKDQGFVRATHRFVCVRLLPEDVEEYREYLGNVFRTPTFVFGIREQKSGKFVEIERLVGYHSLDQFQRYFALIEKKLREREPPAPYAAKLKQGRPPS